MHPPLTLQVSLRNSKTKDNFEKEKPKAKKTRNAGIIFLTRTGKNTPRLIFFEPEGVKGPHHSKNALTTVYGESCRYFDFDFFR
jgi:hypothetical protein